MAPRKFTPETITLFRATVGWIESADDRGDVEEQRTAVGGACGCCEADGAGGDTGRDDSAEGGVIGDGEGGRGAVEVDGGCSEEIDSREGDGGAGGAIVRGKTGDDGRRRRFERWYGIRLRW